MRDRIDDDVRDKIEDLRSRARGDSTGAYSAAPSTSTGRQATTTTRGTTGTTAANQRGAIEIPAGTEMDVRLTNTLDSGTAKVEDRFEGTTLVDLNINGRTVIPAGSVVRGVVTAVEPGDAHQPHREDDRQLRSGHGQRPRVSDARHGDAGD